MYRKYSYRTSVVSSVSTAKPLLTSRWRFASVFYEIFFFSLRKGMCLIEKEFFMKHATLSFHVGSDIFRGVS